MTPPRPQKRYRCKYCGAELPAWLEVFQEPNGAMLLDHLSVMHRDQVKYYLDRMPRTTCMRQGPVSEALVTALLRNAPGFTDELVRSALDQLKASGDYQRIIEEAGA